jgi:hypothetical protein
MNSFRNYRLRDFTASFDGIRHLLDRQRKEKRVKCPGTGRSARWQKTGN